MGYQNFKISYGSMDQFYSVACTAINNWMEEINSLANAYTKMIELESFQATGAESAKAYLQEVHGVLLYSIQQVLTSYQTELLLYKKGYYDIDSNIYATIPEEIVLSVKNKLSNESTTLEGIAQSVDSSISSVSDIVFVGTPTKYLLQATLDGLKENLNNYKVAVEQYETDQGNTYQTVLQEALDALQLTVSDYLYSGTNIASYQSGSISGNTYMLDLYEKVQKCSDQVESKREEIEEAVKFQTEVYEQMQADYEAACEARKDEGTANLIMGGLAVVVGTVAIVCTAGMATPVVVTAAVAGGSTVVYGASNMAEGAQDLYYGSIGDLDAVAINPIRDTVFAGNQKLYDAWGSLNMTVAGLCVPVGQAVNGVAGSGTTVLAKTAIKTVGKEMAKDMVMDFASEQIVDYAAENFSLNQTETVLLNLGVSTLLDKGSEAVGDKITGSKGDPFTDKMTYEEAARYNEYWNALENGVHDNVQNGFQGDLSDADPRSALEIEMTQMKADEIVSNMLSKHEVDSAPELKIGEPKVMEDVAISGEKVDVPTAFKQTEFASSYEDRINQTPAESNKKVQFLGERGESLCTLKPPPDAELAKLLSEAGVDGVAYKNAVPDFSPFAEAEVEIEYMVGGKGTYGNKARDLNFQQANVKLAEQLNSSPEMAKELGMESGNIKASDIEKYRVKKDLTWHELNDGKTLQLVPTEINSTFGHLGGVGEINAGAFEK